MNQVAVVHASKTPERVIVLPNEEFDVLTDRPGYRLCDDGDLERVERQSCLCYGPAAKQPKPDNRSLRQTLWVTNTTIKVNTSRQQEQAAQSLRRSSASETMKSFMMER